MRIAKIRNYLPSHNCRLINTLDKYSLPPFYIYLLSTSPHYSNTLDKIFCSQPLICGVAPDINEPEYVGPDIKTEPAPIIPPDDSNPYELILELK